MDRAGLSPNDGATHHGMYDVSYLRCVPGAVIMAPSNEDELADMMATGLAYKGPAFIRYPRGNAAGVPMKHYPEALTIGRAKRVRTGKTVDIWALGTILEDANKLCARMSEHGIESGVVDARFAKPLDEEMLFASAEKHH